jgi:protease I
VRFLFTDGAEQVEVTEPLEAVRKARADPSDYDGLVRPGGVANPDRLRANKDAVKFVRTFFEQNKPAGIICDRSCMLVETGVAKGRKVTSWPSLRTDLRNAGADWVDKEVVSTTGSPRAASRTSCRRSARR